MSNLNQETKKKPMRYMNHKSTSHKVVAPPQPVFEVTFGCHYRAITCLKIAAPSGEEARRIAETLIQDSRIEGPEDPPKEYIASMGNTHLLKSSLLSVKPQKHPKVFDLVGVDLPGFLDSELPK